MLRSLSKLSTQTRVSRCALSSGTASRGITLFAAHLRCRHVLMSWTRHFSPLDALFRANVVSRAALWIRMARSRSLRHSFLFINARLALTVCRAHGLVSLRVSASYSCACHLYTVAAFHLPSHIFSSFPSRIFLPHCTCDARSTARGKTGCTCGAA